MENSSPLTLDEACDLVVISFVDSFLTTQTMEYGTRRALQRLTEELRELQTFIEGLELDELEASVRGTYKRLQRDLERLQATAEGILLLE